MAKETAVIDAPPPTKTEGGAPPPPKKPHAGDETSKSIFKQARIDVGLEKPEETPPPVDPPVVDPAAPPEKEEIPPSPEKEKKKGAIPADVLDPSKAAAPTVHDAVAEIQAAELPKNAKKEQIDSFNKLKTKAAEQLQAALDRAAALEKQASESTNKAEIEALQKRAQGAEEKAREIEESFAKVSFEHSPKFKAQFVEQEKTAIELAKSYLDGTDVKPDIVELAAHATGRRRLEILKDAGVDESTITAIMPHLANFDTIQRNKKAALDNWQVLSKQEREQAQQAAEKAKAARSEQENKVWDGVLSKARTAILPLRESKENPQWTARGEQLATRAKEIFNGNGADLPTFAETILKGVAYDAQQEVIDHLKVEVSNLRTENERLKSAAPGGVISAGTKDGAPVDTSKMSREDVAKSTFNSELAKARGG